MITTAEKKGILLDTTRCIGCGAARCACKEKNKLPVTSGRTSCPGPPLGQDVHRGAVDERALRPENVHALPGADLRVGLPDRSPGEDPRRDR